jgi:hypothetical protein
MARRGRKRQLDAESLYWQLILSGVGTVAACKEVGIGRKTATGGERRTAGCRRTGWLRMSGRAGTCRCWNASGSQHCTGTG